MSHLLALVRSPVAAAIPRGRAALPAPVTDLDYVTVPVNISPSLRCSRWQESLRRAGWRAFGKVCSKTLPTPIARTDWLLKHEEQVFAFHQLDRLAAPQQLRLPPASAQGILQALEHAGLIAP